MEVRGHLSQWHLQGAGQQTMWHHPRQGQKPMAWFGVWAPRQGLQCGAGIPEVEQDSALGSEHGLQATTWQRQGNW